MLVPFARHNRSLGKNRSQAKSYEDAANAAWISSRSPRREVYRPGRRVAESDMSVVILAAFVVVLLLAGLAGVGFMWTRQAVMVERMAAEEARFEAEVAASEAVQRLHQIEGEKRRLAEQSGKLQAKVSQTLSGHTGPITGVAFSSDSQRVASSSKDGTIRIWDLATGTETLSIPASQDGVFHVTFSPDDQQVTSIGGDGWAKVWDAMNGQAFLTLDRNSRDNRALLLTRLAAAISPDGKWLASTKIYEEGITRKNALPAAGEEDKVVKVWDANAGTEVFTLQGHEGRVTCVAFNFDGQRLASAGADGVVKIWDLQTGQVIHTCKGHTGEVLSVAFSPGGRYLASGGADQALKTWDVSTGQEHGTLQGHNHNQVTSVAFSRDGRYLASAGSDSSITLWDLTYSESKGDPANPASRK
jgi:WD40 repeat protein